MPEDSYYCSVCDMQPARAVCHGFRAWALHHGFWARALCHGSVGFASPPQADGPAFCRTISRPIIGPNTQKKTLQLINNNTLEVKDPKQQDLEICKMTKSGAYNLGDYTSRTTDLESGKALTCVGGKVGDLQSGGLHFSDNRFWIWVPTHLLLENLKEDP